MAMKNTIPVLLPATVLACAGMGVQAATWTTTANVAPAVTYTDNVCLDSENEQGKWIALVTPAVGISADGNRADLNLNASVEVNSLSDSDLENEGCNPSGFGSNRKQFAPRLNGGADVILVENWLYIDANANIDQNEASPFIRGGGDSLDRTGNTNTTYQYNVSPYIARQFKDTAKLELRYTYDDQYNTENVVGDSAEQSALFNLGSVPGVSKFIWGIQGDYSKVSYNDTSGRDENDSTLKSARLNLGYQLNRDWQINGSYGDEWNDYVSVNEDIDGEFWDVGLRWTPNSRTTVDAGSGHRFFGNSPRFNVRYRHKRSALSASYFRQLSYDRNIRTLDGGAVQPIAGVGPGQTTLSNSPILDERYSLGYNYEGRRSSFGLTAYQSKQTREENDSESSFRGISATLGRSLSRQLSVSAGISWNEQEPRDSETQFDANPETWAADLAIERQLGKNTSLTLNYKYTDRQSDIDIDEYTENRITATLRINLW